MTVPVKIFDEQTEDGSSLVFRCSQELADQRGVRVSIHGKGDMDGGSVQFHSGLNDLIAEMVDIDGLLFSAPFFEAMTIVPGMIYAVTLSGSGSPSFTLEITGLVEASIGVAPPPVETFTFFTKDNTPFDVPKVFLIKDNTSFDADDDFLLKDNTPIEIL